MRAHLTVRLGRDRGSVTLERRVRAHSEEFSYLSPGEMSRNLRNAWEQVPRVRLRPATRIILAADLGQARTLRDLPPVSTSQLEIMVATRCSEFFRMRGQRLVTRARWLERKRGSVSRAQAIAVDGAWLDAIDAALADTRLGDAPIRLEEHPMALEPPSRSRRRRDREGRVLRSREIRDSLGKGAIRPPGSGAQEAEASRLLEACIAHGWDMRRVASALDMSRATAYRRARQLGLSRPPAVP